MRSGLVSVTFRKLSVEEIIGLCKACGLEEIEWGGDIHVPLGDLDAARKAKRLTRQAGLNVACYGSYVRMTREERPLFPRLAATARALGAPAIRVWAGRSEEADGEEIAESARQLCRLAPDLIITFEYHGGTLTHDADCASALMRRIDCPNARCQWQPPVDLPEEECLRSIQIMTPWLYNVHVFSWQGRERLPLAAREASWKKYLRALQGDRAALLEFVQQDDPANLLRDAKTLNGWLEEEKG